MTAGAATADFTVGQRVWYKEKMAETLDEPACDVVSEPSADEGSDDGADRFVFKLLTPCACQPAPSKPRRARIKAIQGDGEYVITLEGDARETTALQIAPMPDATTPVQPSPALPAPSAPLPDDAVLDLDATVAKADLFNLMARVVIVTADVNEYWERWCAEPPNEPLRAGRSVSHPLAHT